jgi:RNA polymerase sigma-70 factor, ECF subfamily
VIPPASPNSTRRTSIGCTPFVARRVLNRDAAEDLTAEVFHQALATLGTFEWQGTPLVAWLLGIATHELSRYWQRAMKRREVTGESLELKGADDQIERRAILFQLVDTLPPDQRKVVLRRFVEQRTIREIARDLDRSEGAIKQLQLRALENLRLRLRSKS